MIIKYKPRELELVGRCSKCQAFLTCNRNKAESRYSFNRDVEGRIVLQGRCTCSNKVEMVENPRAKYIGRLR